MFATNHIVDTTTQQQQFPINHHTFHGYTAHHQAPASQPQRHHRPAKVMGFEQQYGSKPTFDNNVQYSHPPVNQLNLSRNETSFTHSPYGAQVLGVACAPTNFTIIGRKSSPASGHASDASSNSSDCGHTPSAKRSDASNISDFIGRFETVACTPHGSSSLQAFLRDESADSSLKNAMVEELRPHFSELLLDQHASYLVKAIISAMSFDDAKACIEELCADLEFPATLAVASLHTRRVVQFFLSALDTTTSVKCFGPLLTDRNYFMRIATTQQGCVTIQRIIDYFPPNKREPVFDVVRANIFDLCKHVHGHYVVLYMLHLGDQHRNSEAIVNHICPSILDVSCNKYASNVLEKAMDRITPSAKHHIVMSIYNSPHWRLQHLLSDGVGNYIVQATISKCSFEIIPFIQSKLAPLLITSPFGAKLEAKINERYSRH